MMKQSLLVGPVKDLMYKNKHLYYQRSISIKQLLEYISRGFEAVLSVSALELVCSLFIVTPQFVLLIRVQSVTDWQLQVNTVITGTFQDKKTLEICSNIRQDQCSLVPQWRSQKSINKDIRSNKNKHKPTVTKPRNHRAARKSVSCM